MDNNTDVVKKLYFLVVVSQHKCTSGRIKKCLFLQDLIGLIQCLFYRERNYFNEHLTVVS